MTNSDQEKQLFLAALELPTSAERDAFLRGACADDADLYRRLQLLVAMHDQSRGPLDQPPSGLELEATRSHTLPETVGAQIGPYKLLQQIGEGGMGTVFMAEQHEPVRRRVALKVVKLGMDTRQVMARFEAEHQALSLMDHPNIAKVLDAGATASGRPYFVMELVKGQPITQYCDEQHLTPRERLELFLPVCHAIQHAHQKGIIHRDIKPTNVLVAEYDGRPVAKVIDFGVAKATGGTLTEKTMFTELGAIVGTLEYMSPEQARVNQLDIDTRSDVYSLGVLLYELLTGSTPFDRQRLRSAALDELLRIIREEEPPRPSAKLSSSDTLPSIAANRRIEPARLSALVRGELDWIVMKALEKDRNRRYETANGFAMDVQRYLADEPVLACPPSAVYRFRKFARRNKAALATVGLVASALILGLLGTTWQAFVASWQRDRALRAEQLSANRLIEVEQQQQAAHLAEQQARDNFAMAVQAVDRLYDQLANRIENEPHLTDWQQEMLEAALDYYQRFAAMAGDDPQLQNRIARAHRRVGEIHRIQGNWPEAQQALEEAVRQARQLAATGRLQHAGELAETQMRLAEVLSKSADPAAVEAAFENALASWQDLRTAQAGESRFAVKMALTRMIRGNARHHWGRYQEADDDFRVATQILLDTNATSRESTEILHALCSVRISRATNFVRLHKPVEQEQEEREALKLAVALVTAVPEKVDYRERAALVQSNLAATLMGRNEWEESLLQIRGAVARYEELVRDFPSRAPLRFAAASAYNNLAIALQRHPENADEASKYQSLALAERERLATQHSENLEYQRAYSESLLSRGYDLVAQGLAAEASNVMQQAVAVLREAVRRFPEDAGARDGLVKNLGNLAVTFRRLGQLQDSEKCLREAMEHSDWLTAHFPTSPLYAAHAAMLRDSLASTLAKQQRIEETLSHRREAVRLMQSLPAELNRTAFAPNQRAMLMANLAHTLHQVGQCGEAAEFAKSALAEDASYPLARGLWAEILANCPDPALRDPRQALEVVQPLLDSERSAAYGAGICGIAHFRLEDWAQAKPLLETAATGSGDLAWDTVVQFYLAATLHHLADQERAQTILTDALQRAATLPHTGRDLEEARDTARALIEPSRE